MRFQFPPAHVFNQPVPRSSSEQDPLAAPDAPLAAFVSCLCCVHLVAWPPRRQWPHHWHPSPEIAAPERPWCLDVLPYCSCVFGGNFNRYTVSPESFCLLECYDSKIASSISTSKFTDSRATKYVRSRLVAYIYIYIIHILYIYILCIYIYIHIYTYIYYFSIPNRRDTSTQKNHHPSPSQAQGTNPEMDAMLAVPLCARLMEDAVVVAVVTPVVGATKLGASNAAPPRMAPEGWYPPGISEIPSLETIIFRGFGC